MSERPGRGLVADSARFALSQYLSRAVLLARGLLAAAALGPAGFGAWNALVLILDYGNYASWGALYGLDLVLPPLALSGDATRARQAMRGAWGLTLAGGAAFALAVILYLRAGTWLALTGWGWGPPLLVLAAAILQLAIHYHSSVLRAHGDFAAVSEAVALQAILGGGIGLFAVWRAGVWGLLWGWLAGSAIALVRLRRSTARPPLDPAPPAEGVPLARLGLPLFAYFALTLLLRSFDRIALVRFGGNEALGRYSVGLIAAGLVLYLPEAAATVLFPRIAAAAEGARDPIRTREEVLRAQRALTVLLPLPVGVAALWAGPIITALLPAFSSGVPALRILAMGALLVAAATLPGYTLLGMGRGLRVLPWVAGAVLAAGLLIFGVAAAFPRASAVAGAAAVGQGLFAAVVLAIGMRELEPDPARRRRWILTSLIPTAWAALLLVAVVSFGNESAIATAVKSALFAAAYLVLAVPLARGIGLARLLRGWLAPG